MNNIDDHDLDELADKLYLDLKLAGILSSPGLYFVAFSMGGVVLRHLVLKNEVRPNGIVFVASPLHGSSLDS